MKPTRLVSTRLVIPVALVVTLAFAGCSGEGSGGGKVEGGDAAQGSDTGAGTTDTGSGSPDTGATDTGGGGTDTGGGTTDTGAADTGSGSTDTGSGSTDTGSPADTGSTADTGTTTDTGSPYDNPCNSGPLDAPIADCRPSPLPSTGDPAADCVQRINQLRWECQCLPPLQRWNDGEQCADQMASYDAQHNTAHKGFRDNICSPRGFAQNECPGWGSWDRVISGCLQMMWDEGPGEDFQAHGHYINMSSTRYTMVACGAGDGWFLQNFR